MVDHSARVSSATLACRVIAHYKIAEKSRLWPITYSAGAHKMVLLFFQVMHHVLDGEGEDQTPLRLWETTNGGCMAYRSHWDQRSG